MNSFLIMTFVFLLSFFQLIMYLCKSHIKIKIKLIFSNYYLKFK